MIFDFSNANANKTFSIILHDRKVQKSFYSNLPFPQIALNLKSKNATDLTRYNKYCVG